MIIKAEWWRNKEAERENGLEAEVRGRVEGQDENGKTI